MKKTIIAVLVFVLCISAVGAANWLFGNPGGVKIDYNNCTEYSEEEIDSAAQVVIQNVNARKGCVLFSLKFITADELDYCRSLNKDVDYAECIVLKSAFRSPLKSRFGAWNANRLYTWDWYLARVKDGQWEIVTEGYA